MKPPSVAKVILEHELVMNGFQKRRGLWIRKRGFVWDIAFVQKSQYDRSYMLRIGFFLREVEPRKEPAQGAYHAQLIGFMGELDADFNEALDDECPIPEAQRRSVIERCFGEKIIPALGRFNCISDFEKYENTWSAKDGNLEDQVNVGLLALWAPLRQIIDSQMIHGKPNELSP